MNLETILKNYGLSEKQSKVYLACLSAGSGSVQSISKLANIPRSTTYEILDELKDKRLVTTFQKKKAQYFSAENPATIISDAKEKVNLLEKALPDFMAIYNSLEVKPSVRFYEGLHNLNIVWQEVLKEAKEYIVFSAADNYENTLGEDFKKFLVKRSMKGIKTRAILQDTPSARILQSKDALHIRESKLAPKEYTHHSSMMIWNNKVAMLNVGNDYSLLIIESKDVSLFYKSTFDLIWSLLP